MEWVTCDDILNYLEKAAAEKLPLPPDRYLEAAQALNALQGGEDDKLFIFEQKVARMRSDMITAGATAAAARIHVEAMDDYYEAKHQKAKIDRIKETIRLSKIRARLASEELRSQ